MKKAIIIVLFFCSLFIVKEVFADNGYPDFTTFDFIDNTTPDFYATCTHEETHSFYFSLVKKESLNGIGFYNGKYSSGAVASENGIIMNMSNNLCAGAVWDTRDIVYIPAGNYLVIMWDVTNSPVNYNGYWYYDILRVKEIISDGVSYLSISSPLPEISSITPSYPVNTTIEPPENVNQIIKVPVTLTGNYTNIDEYSHILVYGLDEGVLGREYVLCESDIGESGEYSCSVDFWTNKTYNYEMIMTNTPAPSSPSVSSGVISFSIGLPFTPPDDILNSELEECDTTDLSCHLKNAFRWGFIPKKETFYNFVSLSNKIMERAPFGYAKIIYQKLENLQIDETNNIELVSLEAIDEMIYNPFRVAFSYILYFVFVVGLYFRFRNINI